MSGRVGRLLLGASVWFLATAGCSWIFIAIDAHEFLFETLRAHEDQQWDEIVLGTMVGSLLFSLGAAGILGVQHRHLRRETQRRLKIESELSFAQRLQAVGTLAGGLAHSLNNILTPITMLSEVMLERSPEGSPERAHLARIVEASHKGTRLVRGLLGFCRLSPVGRKDIAVAAMIGNVLALVESLLPGNVRLDARLGADSGVIRVNLAEVETAVFNVLNNAIDAMRDTGGTLAVDVCPTRFEDPPPELLGNRLTGPCVCIRVSDTGHGMEPAVLSRAFEPFFTTKEVGKGTGLGLSTTLGIVGVSGGAMAMVSSPGKGTVVSLYFPRIDLVGRQGGSRECSIATSLDGLSCCRDDGALRSHEPGQCAH